MKTAEISKPRSRRWTVEQYARLAELGFFEDERVELIDGSIIQMAAQKEPHVLGVTLAMRAASKAFGDQNYYVRPPAPLRMGRRSKPEPDVAVVAGNVRDYASKETPAGALLVIEVSDTTLRFDRGRKAAVYARNQVADYWIVNLMDRQLEVHRDPIADPTHKWGFRYDSIQIFKPGSAVSPLAALQATIAVNDLLP
ncbi:MAG TPA: Uma2 family endonuclease [Humisphaera sp.]|nr:Uma2 family endonuclease [Humisphaera sp.]